MSLANELSSISVQNDKDAVISVINQALHRSGTPTSADLNAKLRGLQNRACGIEEPVSAALDVRDLTARLQKNYIPDLRTRTSVSQTTVLQPMNTRLPPTTSVSPGPQAHADMRSSFSGPSFTLSSRYQRVGTASSATVGPGSYEVDANRIAKQSTKPAVAKPIAIKNSQCPWHSFGPGPGKYNVASSDIAVSNGKIQREVRLHDGRQEHFMSFCPIQKREVRPDPSSYRPRSVGPKVVSQPFPQDGIETPRSLYGKSATVRCPDSYCYDIRAFSRKLFPEQARSLRRSELSSE